MHIHKYSNQIIHFQTQSRYELGMSFVRLQEFYEGPVHTGKVFSLTEYKKWFKQTYDEKRFTYCSRWCGYNLPSNVVENFFAMYKRPRKVELAIKKECSELEIPYYVIGTVSQDLKTIRHEIAHAFWFLYDEYHQQMSNLMSTLYSSDQLMQLGKKFDEIGYSSAVFADETQAFTVANADTNLKRWEIYPTEELLIKATSLYNEFVRSKLDLTTETEKALLYC